MEKGLSLGLREGADRRAYRSGTDDESCPSLGVLSIVQLRFSFGSASCCAWWNVTPRSKDRVPSTVSLEYHEVVSAGLAPFSDAPLHNIYPRDSYVGVNPECCCSPHLRVMSYSLC